MAQRAEHIDWTDRESIRQRAKNSVREFISPVRPATDPERPLSPELVTRVTEGREDSGEETPPDDGNVERIHRPTEQSRINESPNTTWPG